MSPAPVPPGAVAVDYAEEEGDSTSKSAKEEEYTIAPLTDEGLEASIPTITAEVVPANDGEYQQLQEQLRQQGEQLQKVLADMQHATYAQVIDEDPSSRRSDEPPRNIGRIIPEMFMASPRIKSPSQERENQISAEIKQRVQEATKAFESLTRDLKNIIVALRAQQSSIQVLGENRFKSAELMEALLTDTPTSTVLSSSGVGVSDDGSRTTVKSKIATVKQSYLELQRTQRDVMLRHAKAFESDVVKYAEDWLDTISSRVKFKVGQYKALSDSLRHYVTKVERLKARHNPGVPEKVAKLERNETKLRGTREAHDTMGVNLYMLLEEVTERAWKDLLPLMMKSMELDLAQAKEDRHLVRDRLNDVLDSFKRVSGEHNVASEGRLQSLQKDRVESLYSGIDCSSQHRAMAVVQDDVPPSEEFPLRQEDSPGFYPRKLIRDDSSEESMEKQSLQPPGRARLNLRVSEPRFASLKDDGRQFEG
jgi:hypothetical protein